MCRTNPFHVKMYGLMSTCCISTVVHRTSVQKTLRLKFLVATILTLYINFKKIYSLFKERYSNQPYIYPNTLIFQNNIRTK